MPETYHYRNAEITIDMEKPTTTVVIHHPGGEVSKPIFYPFNLVTISEDELFAMYAKHKFYSYLFLTSAKKEMVKQPTT